MKRARRTFWAGKSSLGPLCLKPITPIIKWLTLPEQPLLISPGSRPLLVSCMYEVPDKVQMSRISLHGRPECLSEKCECFFLNVQMCMCKRKYYFLKLKHNTFLWSTQHTFHKDITFLDKFLSKGINFLLKKSFFRNKMLIHQSWHTSFVKILLPLISADIYLHTGIYISVNWILLRAFVVKVWSGWTRPYAGVIVARWTKRTK